MFFRKSLVDKFVDARDERADLRLKLKPHPESAGDIERFHCSREALARRIADNDTESFVIPLDLEIVEEISANDAIRNGNAVDLIRMELHFVLRKDAALYIPRLVEVALEHLRLALDLL